MKKRNFLIAGLTLLFLAFPNVVDAKPKLTYKDIKVLEISQAFPLGIVPDTVVSYTYVWYKSPDEANTFINEASKKGNVVYLLNNATNSCSRFTIDMDQYLFIFLVTSEPLKIEEL